ncbi:hypothetical protein QLX08_005328 [Tetragonisca angustula]|uniref:Uncharacterized protein n=1 Tax=Tetragonisca angustula TaxID=166442 RepID=A0AAW1A0R9_9HYME
MPSISCTKDNYIPLLAYYCPSGPLLPGGWRYNGFLVVSAGPLSRNLYCDFTSFRRSVTPPFAPAPVTESRSKQQRRFDNSVHPVVNHRGARLTFVGPDDTMFDLYHQRDLVRLTFCGREKLLGFCSSVVEISVRIAAKC